MTHIEIYDPVEDVYRQMSIEELEQVIQKGEEAKKALAAYRLKEAKEVKNNE